MARKVKDRAPGAAEPTRAARFPYAGGMGEESVKLPADLEGRYSFQKRLGAEGLWVSRRQPAMASSPD